MSEKIIPKYTTSIIQGLIGKAKAISDLEHNFVKGRLREYFISDILNNYCTSQLGIGTGVVINQLEIQSNELDIIIYDNRILPPFIKHQNLGVYPAESVLAVIEVKSNLNKTEIINAANKARFLKNNIYDENQSLYRDYVEMKPIFTIIGFWGSIRNLLKIDDGRTWLSENAMGLSAICLINKFCWIKMDEWTLKKRDENNGETKRFLAVLFDNIRRISNQRYNQFGHLHRDWLSIYTRE